MLVRYEQESGVVTVKAQAIDLMLVEEMAMGLAKGMTLDEVASLLGMRPDELKAEAEKFSTALWNGLRA